MNVNMDEVGKLVVCRSYVAYIAVIVSTASTHLDVASDKMQMLFSVPIEGIFLAGLIDDVSRSYAGYS